MQVAFQRQYNECDFFKRAKLKILETRVPTSMAEISVVRVPILWGAPLTWALGESNPKLLQSLSTVWRMDEKGCSTSHSLEGDQVKEGELGVSAFQCIYNLLSSWIFSFPQNHSAKHFWCGRMCWWQASQDYTAKVALPHRHLKDMTETLVKNGLTFHYSKSLFIWEWNLVLGSSATAAAFSLFCVCGHKLYICCLYIHYYLFVYTADTKYMQICKCRYVRVNLPTYAVYIHCLVIVFVSGTDCPERLGNFCTLRYKIRHGQDPAWTDLSFKLPLLWAGV